MSAGPWRRGMERRLRRGLPPWVLTWLVAAAVMLCAVRLTEHALRPVLSAAARYQVQRQVTAAVEQWAAQDLQQRGVDYSDFVTITRNDAGEIVSLSADMAALNLLRAELSAHLLERIIFYQSHLLIGMFKFSAQLPHFFLILVCIYFQKFIIFY